jgi:nucleotide-binding universal stress UspA family protein
VTHVLVATDGSPLGGEALRFALDRFPDARVTVVCVVDPAEPGGGGYLDVEPSYPATPPSEEWSDRAAAVAARLLDEAAAVAAERGREVETVHEVGDPGEVVVDYAADAGVDHVVVGAHGRETADAVFGTVAETVARRAPVSTTLVR